jgi:hypothetical protein
MDKPEVYRSTMGLVMGWAWAGLAMFFLLDVAWRGRDFQALATVPALLLIIGTAYAVGIRPKMVASGEGVRLRNPFRDTWLPWGAVDDVDVTDAVRIHSGDETYRAWVLQTSPRARAKARQRSPQEGQRLPDSVAETVRGRTPADFAVEQLRRMADARGGASREAGATAVSVTWHWPAVLAVGVPVVLCVVAVVVASLR